MSGFTGLRSTRWAVFFALQTLLLIETLLTQVLNSTAVYKLKCSSSKNVSKPLADQSAPAGLHQTDLTLSAEDQPELRASKGLMNQPLMPLSSPLPTILLGFVSTFHTTYPKQTNLVRLLTFLRKDYHNPPLIFTQAVHSGVIFQVRDTGLLTQV